MNSKAPLKWWGSKQRLAPKIIERIPPHTAYVEPFCGAAAVFWARPWPVEAKPWMRRFDASEKRSLRKKGVRSSAAAYREVLNDLDHRIYNFFQVLQDEKKRAILIDRLHATPYSREQYRIARKLAFDTSASDIDRAWAVYVHSHQSYGGTMGAGWGYAQKTGNDCPRWIAQVDRLWTFCRRLRSVYLEHDDAIKVIKRWDRPTTFFYVDPPYIGTDNDPYLHTYSDDDFQQLCDTLMMIKGQWLMTSYPHPYAEFLNFQEARFVRHTVKPTHVPDLDNKKIEVIYSRPKT